MILSLRVLEYAPGYVTGAGRQILVPEGIRLFTEPAKSREPIEWPVYFRNVLTIPKATLSPIPVFATACQTIPC